MNNPVDSILQATNIRYLVFLVMGLLFLMLAKLPLAVMLHHGHDYGTRVNTISFVKSNLTIEEISQDPSMFQPVTGTPNFGYGAATYWLKLDLKQLDQTQQHTLKIAFPILNEAILHYETRGEWQTYQAGIDIPHAQWSVHDRNIVFPLHAGQQEVYLELTTKHTLLAPIELTPTDAFHRNERVDSLVWGAFYGLVFIMLVYNGLLYFSTRQESYLYYVGYVASTALFVSSLNGIGYQYIWPQYPGFNSDSGTIFPCLMMLFSIQFTQLFLEMGKRLPRFNSALNVIQALNLALLLSAIIFATDLNLLTTLLVDVSVITILSAGLYSLSQGHIPARFFVVGWTAFLMGVGTYAFTMLGLLPANGFTLHAKEAGFVIEIMLLSFALADRINILKAESVQANIDRELALKVANRALNESVKAKDEFLTTISHELRTPINGFIGSLEVLSDSDLSRQQKQTLGLAYQSAMDMYALIETMLDFSEIQNNSMKLKPIDFALKASLRDLERKYTIKADIKNIEFELGISEACPEFARGDGQRLMQIIDQLLDNALKFTLQGRIVVQLASEPHPTEPNDFTFKAIVTDTGVGIPKGSEEKILLPFIQIDGSNTRGFEGLGLGLPLSAQLAKKCRAQ